MCNITHMIKYLAILLFIIGTAAVLLILSDITVESNAVADPPPKTEAGLTDKVNAWRTQRSLPSLPEEESLCKYAKTRSREIKTEWNHNKFLSDQCSQTNYGHCGENLSQGYTIDQEILTAWEKSPTHLENLESNWSAMCIRCTDGHCAQEFGI